MKIFYIYFYLSYIELDLINISEIYKSNKTVCIWCNQFFIIWNFYFVYRHLITYERKKNLTAKHETRNMIIVLHESQFNKINVSMSMLFDLDTYDRILFINRTRRKRELNTNYGKCM